MKPKARHQLNGETHDIRETLRDGIVVAKRLVEEADYLIETSRDLVEGWQERTGIGDRADLTKSRRG